MLCLRLLSNFNNNRSNYEKMSPMQEMRRERSVHETSMKMMKIFNYISNKV